MLETIKSPMYDSDGNIVGVLRIARDITQRQQVKNDIQALVESTVGHIGQNLFEITAKTLCEWFDCECAIIGEIVENDNVEALSMILEDRLVDDYGYKLEGTPCDRVRNKGLCIYPDNICELFPNDKDLVDMNAVGYIGTPLFGDANEPIGILCAISRKKLNIPKNGKKIINIIAARISAEIKRQRAEDTLRLNEKRLNSILQTNPNPVVVYDTKGFSQFVNPSFTQVFGWAPHEIQGKTIPFVPEDEKEITNTKIKEVFESGKPMQFLTKRLTKSNKVLDVNISAAIYKDAKEENKGLVVNLTDITDQLKLEEQLRQAQKMESIGNLAGGIAHDFNNLLVPIIGMSEMLLEDLPEDSLEYENVEEIFHAGKRAGDLVNQILAFSRQSEHKMSPVRVQSVLKEVLKLSRSTIPANIEIRQNIQQNCGLVMADPTQIHQIAMNLITNAFHAVEEKNGTVNIELKEVILKDNELPDSVLKSGQFIRLTVSDNGTGMSQNTVNKIFEPYFTTKEQGKGTGLGLAVVYGIVKEHGGDIKVYSEMGKRTTFSIYLPLVKKLSKITAVENMERLTSGTESILLVDDEVSVAKLEGQILARLGYQTTIKTSSVDALSTFRKNPKSFDLVISDMTMPDMTGDQLAEKILSIKPDTPIIICTGFSERINKELAETLGVKGLLMKPVVKSDMAQMVRKALDEAKNS
ncbi:MAG: PAS domain S-box protein [Desulfobacteraceae bacterium]|nr:PAS domain S-box protein [Desulfobacteraceae bacterium]